MQTCVETRLFTKLVQEYMSADEYGELQQALVSNPEAGDVIPGSGGFGNGSVPNLLAAPGRGRLLLRASRFRRPDRTARAAADRVTRAP
jgi:hypothetical protein